MANKTTNYELVKPLASEFYDVEVQNGNMDKIDAGMKANADKLKTLQDGQKKHASQHASGGSDPITPASIGAIPTSDKGKAGGVATLDSSGKVPSNQIPSLEYAAKKHASQHATRGSDPITPASIGAAPAYTYGTADLTAGSSTLETGKIYLCYE